MPYGTCLFSMYFNTSVLGVSGVSEWGSTSGRGTCCNLVVVHPSLVPPGTQLLHVVPHSCLHATAATPKAMALTGQLNHVRVANRSGTLGELGLAYLHI